MNKIKYNLLLCIILIGLGANAQPILTATGNIPVKGDNFLVQGTYTNNSTLPKAGGTNQVWDYSNLSDSGSIGTISVVDTTGVPGASNFPTANIAWYDPIQGDYIFFNNKSSQTFGEIGEYYSSDSWGAFSPQVTRMAFPMSYKRTYTDSASFTKSSISGVTFQISDTLTADGYGTLKLPHNATFTNVLRVKLTLRITYFLYGTPLFDSTSYFYEYGQEGIHYPLLELSSVTKNSWIAEYFAGFPVPIQISNFNTSWQNSLPNLQWTANNIDNLKQFNIQRSIDGSTFTDVGFVNVLSNTSYQFTDESYQSGSVYYRIKQIGKDGSVFYSNISKLQPSTSNSFSIWPNPTSAALHISLSTGSPFPVIIYNEVGKLVYDNKSFTSNVSISMENWSKGVYFIKIKEKDSWQTQKFEKK